MTEGEIEGKLRRHVARNPPEWVQMAGSTCQEPQWTEMNAFFSLTERLLSHLLHSFHSITSPYRVYTVYTHLVWRRIHYHPQKIQVFRYFFFYNFESMVLL